MIGIDFSNLEVKDGFAYFMSALAILLPGIGYIYFVHPDFLINYDLAKLILLALFFSFPVFTISMIVTLLMRDVVIKRKNIKLRKEEYTGLLVVSSFTSLLSFLVSRVIVIFNTNYQFWLWFYLTPSIICLFFAGIKALKYLSKWKSQFI